MQTKVIETYSVEELEGYAKERALEWLSDGIDSDWYDSIFDDAKKCASILGIEIDNIYFDFDNGACFNGRFSYAKGWKKALKKYAPMDKELFHIGQALQVIQSPYFYNLSGAISCNDRYKTTKADFHWSDNIPEDTEDNINQVFSDFSAWIYKNLRAEYEWLMSEEQLIETSKANDYTFDENGRIA